MTEYIHEYNIKFHNTIKYTPHTAPQGFPGEISDVKCHPKRALAAFTCSDPGSLQIWNYEMKLLMSVREFNSFKEGKDLSLKSSSSHNKSLKAFKTNINSRGLTMHGDMK